jgi:hypothetical protein
MLAAGMHRKPCRRSACMIGCGDTTGGGTARAVKRTVIEAATVNSKVGKDSRSRNTRISELGAISRSAAAGLLVLISCVLFSFRLPGVHYFLSLRLTPSRIQPAPRFPPWVSHTLIFPPNIVRYSVVFDAL